MSFRVLLIVFGILSSAGTALAADADNPVELNNQGLKLVTDGHVRDALPILERAMHAAAKTYGDNNQSTDTIAHNYAKALLLVEQRALAGRIMEHMRDNYIKRYGPTDVRLAPVYLDLGRALSLQDSSKAKKALNNAINLYENKNQRNDPDYVRALIQLGYAEAWNFRPLAAKSDYQRALEISSEIFGDSAEITGEAHVALGQCYLTLGHYKSAEQEYKRAIAIFDARLSPTDVRTLAARGALVPLYKKQGRTDEAMEQTMELAMLAPDAEGQEQPLYQIAPENLYNGTNGFYQGAVEVKFTVTTEGRVEDIQFVGKRSNTVTEDTIRKAMSQWIYKPRVVNGKPVESHRSIRFNFSHFN